ncbi:PREDICTED: protein FAM35A-like isoform X2 [Amphimedon queenslandica]|uniref:Shieldin complex subunit 2 C-terminal domain-containing protein n=2 Tax=Amphimedon queenslandica TaxID=400682 RepID=A0AAN0J6C7_AMPQE|nr:PREDICTED: protein FAM35A-like isoform X2 [Amphimedon queenslandica]|eukprot:XP_019852276.1 PREDICTED: protein FAM35A-like isoform X2 [Amphimedon queenslandica]
MASSSSPPAKKLNLEEAGTVLSKDNNIITLKKDFLKELDEEDTQIESSLPSYLSTIYGFHSSYDTANSPLLFNSPPCISQTVAKQPEYAPPPGCQSLVDCSVIGQLVSVLAIITQVNPLREINMKNSEKVAIASVLLSDPTLFHFKLTLWREAAQWAERLTPGDIILLSNMRVKEWQGEKVGHTVLLTRLLNIHQCKRIPLKIRDKIPQSIYSNFYSWAIRDHFFLFEKQNKAEKCKIDFKRSDELFSESLIHFRGKLLKIISNKKANLFSYTVLLMSDSPTSSVLINIIGHQSQLWFNRLIKGVGLVWDATYLIVLPEGSQAGYTVLQSTSRSCFKYSDQSKAQEVLKIVTSNPVSADTRFVSVSQLNEVRSSGMYHVKARATSMRFIMESGNDGFDLCSIKGKTDNNEIDYHQLLHLLEACLYIGCGICSRASIQDANGVYCLCTQCSGKSIDVSCIGYFRPLLVTLGTESSSHIATAPSTIVNQLLADVCSPDSIKNLNSLPNEKVVSVGVALCRRILELMAERDWVICIDALCDTNSFILSIKSTVLTVNL